MYTSITVKLIIGYLKKVNKINKSKKTETKKKKVLTISLL